MIQFSDVAVKPDMNSSNRRGVEPVKHVSQCIRCGAVRKQTRQAIERQSQYEVVETRLAPGNSQPNLQGISAERLGRCSQLNLAAFAGYVVAGGGAEICNLDPRN